MKYKDYTAKIEYDDEAGIFHGSVLDLLDVITFQGTSIDELKTEFAQSVDTYLEMCREDGVMPEKPFSGRFVMRVSPDLHRSAVLSARRNGLSLNKWVEKVISDNVYDSCSHQARNHEDIGHMPTITHTKTVKIETTLPIADLGKASQAFSRSRSQKSVSAASRSRWANDQESEQFAMSEFYGDE